MREFDVTIGGGVLHAYDSGTGGAHALPVVWHHGTPNIGTPPRPLLDHADRLGLRLVGYDRPGYGGSTPRPDRTVASAGADTADVVDALDAPDAAGARPGRPFAVLGHSGGGPHALACAALLPDRVVAAVSISGLAPYDPTRDADWFAGFSDLGAASLRAAVAGRAAKEEYESVEHEGDMGFIAADGAAFDGEWGWIMEVVRPALAAGPAPLIDDDLAYVRDWGFAPSSIRSPVRLVHGGLDRMVPAAHSAQLARSIPHAVIDLTPDDGHISILRRAAAALEWIAAQRDERPNES
ncbi:alpha/beta fold hydrolase [Yonghaparkia sp. Soil809]|uniref:alpha/beta fold hydrolase n=1 Tax=Yonghaparkia sp. Soil809 TaxID=1736417 RepID=UPI0006FD893F|nr:alpha/beta fold hydrolase [Yonghaparkia sp. Soil809]KRF33205.1 alpha/beta hydrolase [Yonghaparkia sp. Soil809]